MTTGQRVVEVPIPTRYTKESSSIAIDRSLRYIVGTLGYCARTTILRGRRGRRARSSGPASHGRCRSSTEPCPACAAATEPVAPPRPWSDAELRDSHGVRCPSCGLVSSGVGRSRGELASHVGDTPDAEAVLDVLGAYYTPSNRLLVLGHDQNGVVVALARERGWTTLDADPSGPHDNASARWPSERSDTAIADAIVFRDDDASLPDVLADLELAKSSLHLEGLLVVATGIGSSPRGGLDFETRYVLTRDSVRAVLTRAGFEVVEWIASPRHRLVGTIERTAAREVVVARPAHRAR